jgi:hypothetical protein
VYKSVNTQLNPEAVEDFFQGNLNRPECPACQKQLSLSTPVLFNDMERNFMVWAGRRRRTDPYVEFNEGPYPAVIYAANYDLALAALVMLRADPANAPVPFAEMNQEHLRFYVASFLIYYARLKAELEGRPQVN